MSSKPIYGRVAQLGERLVRNEEVVGSIPITSKFERPRLSGLLKFPGALNRNDQRSCEP